MPAFEHIVRRLYLAVATLSWSTVAALALAHAAATWALFRLAGEAKLTDSLVDFAYYYMTTATTVGYGDLSPATPGGRLAAVLFVLPGSIALFTAVLGKALGALAAFWRRRMNGMGDFSARERHTIVLGWQSGRTRHLIDLLRADQTAGEGIVLVAKGPEQNPLPDLADYVRVDGLSEPSGLRRAGIAGARSVVVRGQDDDETLAATLAAANAGSRAHIVAHFEDARAANLIAGQCPQVEAIASLSSELLVRASRDPGASRIADLLFSGANGDTAFSLPVPEGVPPLPYMAVLVGLKRAHGVTLVGVGRGRQVDLNCGEADAVRGGETIFYIADTRLDPHAVAWDALAAAGAEREAEPVRARPRAEAVR